MEFSVFTLMKLAIVAISLAALAVAQQKPMAPAQPEFKIKKENLKATLVKLGYEPRELGNGVLEVDVIRGDETMFVAVSLSSSLAKIWLTSNLGALTEREKSDSSFLLKLLERNGEIQPIHFFVRKGKLNLGCPVDNRVATGQILGKEIINFADTVLKMKDYWDRKEVLVTTE